MSAGPILEPGAAIHELPELRDRLRVFRDRAQAGEVVAGMLGGLRPGEAVLLAIPAGGIPVAARISRVLGLPLGVAVVSKITPPWNSEIGYGAVAFDGSVRLNDHLVARLGVGEQEIRRGVEKTLRKVRRRVATLRGGVDLAQLEGRAAVLVDDGLASGFTMRVAVEALRNRAAAQVLVAVPTGSLRAVQDLAPRVEQLYCANIRGGWGFAVAEAYQSWTDLSEEEAAGILAQAREAAP